MIRFVIIAVLAVLAWVLLRKLWRYLKTADLDWNGIAVACGFIALAFYLRHVTGIG